MKLNKVWNVYTLSAAYHLKQISAELDFLDSIKKMQYK